ncbi:enoyl-CoA hydratase/isomerase family protein [Novosphingobium resinovorum]|uniref:enoyl-CoA hydratase/isomerase family protein n=1 Tax=Novosphingobium resinovorum TaxID=158500 RepID=UPI002ED35813|nr:enoyl-CoA hydratase-related protein [Novosphingobium resinovorum]
MSDATDPARLPDGHDALDPASFHDLVLRHDGAVLRVTIDRPNAANSLSDRLIAELGRLFAGLYWRSDIRVVVLGSTGKHFCAGLDMKERQGRADPTAAGSLIAQRRISEIVIAMRRCPQPIIAHLTGAASGGGFALALAADVRVATPDLRMNAAFVKIGLSGCDIGVSYFLPRIAGAGFAAEFLMTGRFIDAPRALGGGLVSAVAPPDEIDAVVQGFVDDMLATAPLGLRLTKEALNCAIDAGGLEQVIALEDRNQILCTYEPEFEAALAAFRARSSGKTA